MDQFDELAIAVRSGLQRAYDWAFGCAHWKTSLPITIAARKDEPAETYVVCMQCGRHIAYDWAGMGKNLSSVAYRKPQ